MLKRRASSSPLDVPLTSFSWPGPLLDDPVENRSDGVARTAPFGPEIHDHRYVALQDFLLEGSLRYGVWPLRSPFQIVVFSSSLDQNVQARTDLPSLESLAAWTQSSHPYRPSPTIARSSSRCSRDGKASKPSSGCATATAVTSRGASSMGRHGEQENGCCTTCGDERSRSLRPLPRHAGLRSALSERLRLPRALDRGRRRAGAGPSTRSAR